MNPEVREFMKHAGMTRSAVEQVAAMLPDDDLELDSWVADAIRENDSLAFHLIAFAAFIRERPVDARHLSTGAKLAGGPYQIGAMAFRVQGDMPEYLLEGLRNTICYPPTRAMGLLAITIWCDDRRGGVYPDLLIAEARSLARVVKKALEVDVLLLDIARRTEDAVLQQIIRDHHGRNIPDDKWDDFLAQAHTAAEQYIEETYRPILDVIDETPPSRPEGGTIRRAVPRIGRNEPCHCGSGKKYKHCHYAQDQERLHQSSEVAGLTHDELREDPGHHLTYERLINKPASALVRMDPAAIPRHLLGEYFFRLSLIDIDQAAANIEKLGFDADLDNCWYAVMFNVVRARRKDIGDRLMNLRRPFGFTEDRLHLSQRLLLAQDEPAKWLRLVQAAAVKALETEDSEQLLELAFGVQFSEASALGLLLYRGVLPFVSAAEARKNYENYALPLRDRLKLPVDDPLKDLLDTRSIDAEMALKEAKDRYETKRQEVRNLRETIDQLHKDLARKEREPVPDSPAPPASGVVDSSARQLREQVKLLESELKERHNERNTLQRRLNKLQTRVESLAERMPAQEGDGNPAVEDEESLLLPQAAEDNHPLRLIEFPKGFLERLNTFPHHIARGAMAALGRLAGGDPSAFSGAKRLKGAPTVVRQRVGMDFRLLFRLLDDRIQVIDLIPRQDLERRIKGLK